MTQPRLFSRKVLLRYIFLIGFVLFAWWCISTIREVLDLEVTPANEQDIRYAILFAALAYIGLLALPFVPGAEIGVAMLAAFGSGIAPLIYITTVAAMMLAYVIGRFFPISALERGFSSIGMRRCADLLARAAPLSQEERLAVLLEGRSPRMLKLALKYRYIAIALAVNTPGNSIIGGGGGIMMMAGLSGLFSPGATFLTLLVAVAPVPLMVFVLGLQI
ncbi:hypothetical protein [Tateyamaria sp.]|uniref:hypothetical protein n=1 Tax=Tateyamaria sp. TaxID=1929288 RepID=UPI00329EFC04